MSQTAAEKLWYSPSYYIHKKRKTKIDWSGVSIGDSFNHNIDYYDRLAARRQLFVKDKQNRKTIDQYVGVSAQESSNAVKAQLSPFYTNYPLAAAANAALGKTCLLHYKKIAGANLLENTMQEYLQNPAEIDEIDGDPEAYKKIVRHVLNAVQERLIYADLMKHPKLYTVDIARMFDASQQDMDFQSLPEIINAVIVYGDLMPDPADFTVHPATQILITRIMEVSAHYFKELKNRESRHFLHIGQEWVHEASFFLAEFMPQNKEEEDEDLFYSGQNEEDAFPEDGFRFRKNPSHSRDNSGIPPLDKKRPPVLDAGISPKQQLINAVSPAGGNGIHLPDSGNVNKEDPIYKAVEEFTDTVSKSAAQSKQYEDTRSDLIENMLKNAPFTQGPIEGMPTDGHEVSVKLGDMTASGEIFDRPMELSDDPAAIEDLILKADPLVKKMRNTLYPNIEKIPVSEKLCTSGTLDAGRLAVGEISSSIFKRYRIHEQLDKRGKPVLLIACDGSGSLNTLQMSMLKLLAAGWLLSTANTDIQVLAGLYHSDYARSGITGPIVKWMYHPLKTPAADRKDAVRSVVSLPNSGTGVQSDALSVNFMMDQARRLARGRMIYLILISDCAWNVSFNSGLSGEQEMYKLMETLNAELKDKLHSTLVGLGVGNTTGFETVMDKVIPIAPDELQDTFTVAEKISLYVASLMKERTKLIAKNKR